MFSPDSRRSRRTNTPWTAALERHQVCHEPHPLPHSPTPQAVLLESLGPFPPSGGKCNMQVAYCLRNVSWNERPGKGERPGRVLPASGPEAKELEGGVGGGGGWAAQGEWGLGLTKVQAAGTGQRQVLTAFVSNLWRGGCWLHWGNNELQRAGPREGAGVGGWGGLRGHSSRRPAPQRPLGKPHTWELDHHDFQGTEPGAGFFPVTFTAIIRGPSV